MIGAAFANNGKSPKVKRPAVESERKATPPQSGQKPQEVAEQVGDTVDVAPNNGRFSRTDFDKKFSGQFRDQAQAD